MQAANNHFASAFLPCVTSNLVAMLLLEQLNGALLAPSRDYRSNRLVRTDLQLAEHTQLILDETVLQPGTFTNIGIANLQVSM